MSKERAICHATDFLTAAMFAAFAVIMLHGLLCLR